MIDVTDALITYPDGRECCRLTVEGRALYYDRKRIAWEAHGRCNREKGSRRDYQ